jgi:GNAT superfamily N-acetyltransferase
MGTPTDPPGASRGDPHDPFRIEAVDARSDEAQALVAAYVAEIAATFPGGFDPAASVSADPGELTPPHGTFLVVRDRDGTAIGCGGVKLLDPGTAEVKRMWLAPAARGRGVGRALLVALEDAARTLGATEGRLDTTADLTAAIALYRRTGWVEVPPYNDNAYATHWFAKRLGGTG